MVVWADTKDNMKRQNEVRAHWLPIMIVALIVRIIAALVNFDFRPVPAFTSWAMENVAIALSLHAGHGYSSPFYSPSGPTALIPPGYPLFLAAVMKLFGTGVAGATIVVVIQILLSLLTVVIVMYVTRSQFGVRTANLAGFICAVCVPLAMSPLWIWDTSFSAFFLIGIFAAMPSLSRMRSGFVIAGILCAIAALVNPALLLPLFAICGVSAFRTKKPVWLGLLAFLLVFSPWPLRNMVVMHSYIPFRSSFGDELWIGNHPGGDGDSNGAMNPMLNLEDRETFLREGEIGFVRDKGIEARKYIYANPRIFIRSTLKRISEFWIGRLGQTVTLFLSACAGLVLLWKHRYLLWLYALPLFLFPLPYYVTHVELRYQYVVDPLLVILSAYALDYLLTYIRQGSKIAPLPPRQFEVARETV